MKSRKIIFIVIAIILLAIIIWPRGNYKIARVVNGNTIVLDNGTKVVLIGVSDTERAKDFIEDNYKGVKVNLRCDSSRPFDPKHLGEKETVYAYVWQNVDGQCINSSLIRSGIAPLDEAYLNDSLKAYREYARRAQ